MKIPEEHKPLLKKLGLQDEDFALFDGKSVSYEFEETKGVRLYDPYYRTSYREYMDVEGWSSWSSEEDTFMSTILDGGKEAERRMGLMGRPSEEDIAGAMQKRFRKKKGS